MKKIGFVDYYIDEWHANNYPAWFAEINKDDYKVAYVWAECDKIKEESLSTAEWCEKFGAEQCSTIEELCRKSDYIVILAPSNPEKHLEYAEEVLKYGKRTYIDKTFAPDYGTAKKIFALSEKYNTPFFSSSALRYADELDGMDAESVFITGGGGNFEEYIIHQVEMLVKLMGIGAAKARVLQSGTGYSGQIMYSDGQIATVNYAKKLPFAVYAEKADGTGEYKRISSAYFINLLSDMLNFFETGERSFDPEETLEVMLIRDGLIRGTAEPEVWIELEK